MRTILFFQTGTPEIARTKLAGVTAYAHGRDWDIKFIERESPRLSVKKVLSFWKPDGCIVEASGGANGLSPDAFGNIPVVYQCHDPRCIKGMTACVTSDSPAVSRIAARELLRIGMSHFAFVSWFESVYWSDVKRDAFKKELESLGHTCTTFTPTKGEARDEISLQRRLREWIKTLPSPCGIFTVSDVIGVQILSACKAVKVSVPEEVAILSVNNDEQICEATVPSLASIRLDYRRTGYLAAELLDRTMHGEKVKGHFTVPPGGIVRRASTRIFKRLDTESKLAVETIRRRACDGLMPKDVLSLCSCSRRLAEIRFKAATGRTITEELQSVRMERVHELLSRPDVPISAIANLCGWPSESFLRRLFRRTTGHSLSEERARILSQ